MRLAVFMLLAVLMALLVVPVQAEGLPTASVGPIVIQPVNSSGFEGPTQGGLTLSLHPKLTVKQPLLQQVIDHTTIEFPVAGSQWDNIQAGIGLALNGHTKEDFELKAGIAYIPTLKTNSKFAFIGAITFPIK